MYFLFDTQDLTAQAYKSRGAACRVALDKLGVKMALGQDPVQLANQKMGDRMVVLTLSGAFESISDSDDGRAQELASKFKAAIDQYYELQ